MDFPGLLAFETFCFSTGSKICSSMFSLEYLRSFSPSYLLFSLLLSSLDLTPSETSLYFKKEVDFLDEILATDFKGLKFVVLRKGEAGGYSWLFDSLLLGRSWCSVSIFFNFSSTLALSSFSSFSSPLTLSTSSS